MWYPYKMRTCKKIIVRTTQALDCPAPSCQPQHHHRILSKKPSDPSGHIFLTSHVRSLQRDFWLVWCDFSHNKSCDDARRRNSSLDSYDLWVPKIHWSPRLLSKSPPLQHTADTAQGSQPERPIEFCDAPLSSPSTFLAQPTFAPPAFAQVRRTAGIGRGQPSKSRGSSPRASIIDIDVNVYINIWDSHLVPEWIWVKPLDWSCHGGWSQLTDANPMTIYDQAFMPKWFAKPWA